MPAAEKALEDYIASLADKPMTDDPNAKYHVGFEGSFGDFHTNPRNLTAKMLSRLVAVDGIVTSCKKQEAKY